MLKRPGTYEGVFATGRELMGTLSELLKKAGLKAQVIGELDREKLPGKTVEVVGAFQLINPANWMVTPVRFKVAP